MMNLRLCSLGFHYLGMLAALALIACFSSAALGANEITGSVRNQSRGQPAAGYEVILIRLDPIMPEEARAKTDAQGAFAFSVQYPNKPYLVRVLHQDVSYDQPASVGDHISMEVFDSAPQVRGITGSIEILRTGAKGNLLHVSDMYEIKNESSPPLTQTGEHTFEVYLPANAKIDSVLAAGPGKIGAMISAAPVPGDPGHYTVSFPLRPGVTKLAFNYDVPYDGHAAFRTRRAYPTQQLAVMIPPTMKFRSRSKAFKILATGNSHYQVEAADQLKAGEGPGFEVFGSGALPPLGARAKSEARSASPVLPNPSVSARSRAVLPSLGRMDLHSGKAQSSWPSPVPSAVSAVLLALCAVLVWRARKRQSTSTAKTAALRAHQAQRATTLLEGLKEELFQLEGDRLLGSISGEEYASTRKALENTIKRAAAKAG